eukprot:6172422-Pleurochrysis_carterae.AAC.2
MSEQLRRADANANAGATQRQNANAAAAAAAHSAGGARVSAHAADPAAGECAASHRSKPSKVSACRSACLVSECFSKRSRCTGYVTCVSFADFVMTRKSTTSPCLRRSTSVRCWPCFLTFAEAQGSLLHQSKLPQMMCLTPHIRRKPQVVTIRLSRPSCACLDVMPDLLMRKLFLVVKYTLW